MRNYTHLSLEEREKLYALLESNVSLRKIGRILGRSHSSLARELGRNKTGQGQRSNEYLIFRYVPCKAQRKANIRGAKQRAKAPLKEPLIFLYVRTHLREPYSWSPQQIACRLKLDHPGKSICPETIYNYIYQSTNIRYRLWQNLKLARKKRMKTYGRKVHRDGKIPGSVSIDMRPKEVDKRSTLGHWETDNVIGRVSDKSALSVTVERLTRLTIISKLARKTAGAKTAALINRLKDSPAQVRVSMTADNGRENSYHDQIADKLQMAVFFCHAYHSWEKGTVENTNGRIRRYIPKGVSIDGISERQIAQIEYRLNNTPRKCLGYLTPYEKMVEVLSS